jgi:hypothetical protein
METFESAVVSSCEKRDAWEAKVAAGVHAAMLYASKNPGPAQALITQLRAEKPDESEEFQQMVGHFSEMLAETAGTRRRLPASTNDAVVGSVAAVISGHLRRGTSDQLPELASGMIELTLLPYVGFEAARQWSKEF